MTDFRIRLVRTVLDASDKVRFRKRSYHFPHLTVVRNLSYVEGKEGDRSYSLDLYMPKDGQGLLPVLIDIHGGGFVYGDKKLNQWTSSEMAARGYFVVTLNYPLVPESTIPQQIQTLYQAFHYIRDLAKDYPLDLDRVFLKGDSAGGLLALLCAAVSNLDDNKSVTGFHGSPLDFKGLALVHPMVDIKRKDLLAYTSTFYTAEGKTLRQPRELLAYLPPTWIVSSRNDMMFNQEARRLVRALRRLGKPVMYHEFGYTLKRPLIHIFMVTMNTLSESQKLYDSLDQFFRAL